MKRAYTERKKVSKTGDIKLDLTTAQLAGIGAVALAYNYGETAIDRALGLALGIGYKLYLPLVTRINGMDGKIDLLKLAAKEFNLPTNLQSDFAETLGYFATLKTYREGVIHARVLDADLGLGEVIERRARHSEVLLTETALDGLYAHLDAVSHELACWIVIWLKLRNLTLLDAGDPKRAQIEADLLDATALYQSHRNKRLSLPPLPEFPEEPPESEPLASPLIRAV